MKKSKIKNQKSKRFYPSKILNFSGGFTLIELLVVVSIISLLSSVVLSSLNSARIKAKDAVIKSELNQAATLMNLHYNDAGSYCNDSVDWVNNISACDISYFSGNYASQASAICKVIYNNSKDLANNPGYRILIYTSPSTCSNSFSWSAQLNNGNWYCVGSSGKGEYPVYYGNYSGCYDNP